MQQREKFGGGAIILLVGIGLFSGDERWFIGAGLVFALWLFLRIVEG